MKNSIISGKRGSALGMVMVLLLALSLVIGALCTNIQTASTAQLFEAARMRAARAAESALELTMSAINAEADRIRPGVLTVNDVTRVCNLSTAPTGLFPASQGYTFTRNIAVPVENGVPTTAFTSLSDSTKTYRYVSEVSATYTMPGRSSIHATASMQRSFVHQVIPLFQYAIFFGGTPNTVLPTLSPAVTRTGNGILELNPGQPFMVGGRVHSNTFLYYGSNSGITFQGIVTAVSQTPQNARCPNDPRTGFYGADATFANGTPSVRPYRVPIIRFPCFEVDASNTNSEGPIEFIQMPDAGLDPNAREREYNLAGLKILVNSGSTNVILPDTNNTTLRPRSAGAAGKCEGARAANDSCGFALLTKDGILIPWRKTSDTSRYNDLYRLFDSSVATTVDSLNLPTATVAATNRPLLRFYNYPNRNTSDPDKEPCQVKDFRQNYSGGGRLMNCVSIDVSKLARAVDADPLVGITLTSPSPATPVKIALTVPSSADYGAAAGKDLWNGIVYVRDLSSYTSNNSRGVMLQNGERLPTTQHDIYARGGGLTVVTDGSIYVIGNYNTGGNPPVNTGAASDSPTVAGYTVRPAAVMGDAVTVLSKSWTIAANSTSANAAASDRIPSSTTINTAILSGNVPSSSSAYSGGVENFPRLLEGWTDSTRLTIYGSMICAFPSRYATSAWGTGSYYKVPSRNWYFEPSFNNPNRLPPGTPNAIVFSNGEWVRF